MGDFGESFGIGVNAFVYRGHFDDNVMDVEGTIKWFFAFLACLKEMVQGRRMRLFEI